MIQVARRARWRLGRPLEAALARWRGSIQIRVVTSTIVLGTVALLLLGGFIAEQIRDGLFAERLEQLRSESAAAARLAQERFDASNSTTGSEVQQLTNDVARALQVSGGSDRSVLLLRAPAGSSAILVNDVVTAEGLRELITPQMRAAVSGGPGQHWQSVALAMGPDGTLSPGGTEGPGLVVGEAVTVPVAGAYELYFVYSLDADQSRLEFILRVVTVGGVMLLGLLGVMTWWVTRQVVQPVRSAARIAERLAAGHLTERMQVRGHDEMATLARSFNEMAEGLQDQIRRMEDLSRLQRRFVSDVSHELRTPLTTIRIAGEVLHASKDQFEPAVARSAELLATQLDRFEELLADLLEISRFDAGAAVLDAEERDVRDVVVATLESVSHLAERRGVWLRGELPQTRCTADIDPRRVARILRNLLVNAIEHADGSPVEVMVAADKRAVAVVVRDRGTGMTLEEADHVFDRFWRADPARARTTGGTGLGLAISLEDAHLHGGWLQAWGRPGEGASFRLTLPRRAGIPLTHSPLPLIPALEPVASPVVHRTPEDPASLPDLDRLEA